MHPWRVWVDLDRRQRYTVVGGIVVLILTLAFIRISVELLEDELTHFDAVVTSAIRSLQSPILTMVMRVISAMGSPLTLTVVVLAAAWVLWRLRRRRQVGILLSSIIGGWLLDEVLKALFHRPRPSDYWLAPASGYSFPSGHSMVSAAFYGVLAYVWVTQVVPKEWPRWSARLAVALAVIGILLIGISRIYLGVHYPSDVVAGFAAGAAWGTLCVVVGEAGQSQCRLPTKGGP